jgi:hypothetical protein
MQCLFRAVPDRTLTAAAAQIADATPREGAEAVQITMNGSVVPLAEHI